MRYTAGDAIDATEHHGAGHLTRLATGALIPRTSVQATAGDLWLDAEEECASRQTTRARDMMLPKPTLPAQHKPATELLLPSMPLPAPYTRTTNRLLPRLLVSAPNQRQAIFPMTPMYPLPAIPHAANDLVQTHAELPPADDACSATERRCVGLKHEACEYDAVAGSRSASLTKHGGRATDCYRILPCPPRNTDAIELLSPLKGVRPPNQEASDQVLPMEALPPQPTRNP